MTQLIENQAKKLNEALLDPACSQQVLVELIVENIPEWERLIGCEQHDIHDYSLDVHTLAVIQKVRELEDFLHLKEFERLVVLYAALLHDIEKQESEIDPQHPQRGAEKSTAILFKLGFSEEFINKVYVLIKYHQILGLMASGRLTLPYEELAQKYKDPVLIDLQRILAIADIKSVKKDEAFFNEAMNENILKIVGEVKKHL